MKKRQEEIIDAIFAASFLLFAVSLFIYTQPDSSSRAYTSPTLIQRDIAINAAKQKGEKTYSFTTNFIPGIGTIADPDSHQQDLETKFENQLQAN